MTLIYSSLDVIDKTETIEKIFGESAFEASEALIRAAHYIDDQEWLISLVEQRLGSGDITVQIDTLVALSAVIRNASNVNMTKIKLIIRTYKTNNDLVGYCEDVEDDIARFC